MVFVNKLKLQLLGLEGVPNARELGGYVLPDGGIIRHGLLLRGGSLSNASARDKQRMCTDYKVSHVFDFRTDMELQIFPDPEIAGAKHTWLPTIDPEMEKLGTATLPGEAYRNLPVYLSAHASSPQVQEIARHIYTDMVVNEYTQLQYAAFLQSIINTNGGAVYWHCSQGKDRTGLGAAFLLAALGADRRLIVSDFDLSNAFYQNEVDALIEKIHGSGGGIEEEKVIRTFVGVNTDYFIDALDLIDKTYGSLEKYLSEQLCLTDDDRKILKERYIEYR